MGMAQAEAKMGGAEVGPFYRELLSNGSYSTSGRSGQINWHGADGRFEATYHQMDESLPTIIILQHSGGRWWDIILPRLLGG
jgi:hypothetical protein